MNSEIFSFWTHALSPSLNGWEHSWRLQPEIGIEIMAVPDGCNYVLPFSSDVWTWKTKTNQPTNQIYSLKNMIP